MEGAAKEIEEIEFEKIYANMENQNSILIFIILCLVSILGFAQEPISNVEYLRTSKVVNRKGCEGINTLYFTKDKSLFVHNEYPENTEYLVLNGMTHMVKGDYEKYPIFTDLTTDSVIQKISYHSVQTPFRLKDTIGKINWLITGNSKEISGIRCISAEGLFGNRVYEVWFSPDIPVPFGPHRLGGLPGLILEARSKDGYVNFEFVRYESKVNDEMVISYPKNGKLVTWKDIQLLTYQFHERHLAMDRPPGSFTMGTIDPDINFEVEKGYYIFMSQYKEWKEQQKKLKK